MRRLRLYSIFFFSSAAWEELQSFQFLTQKSQKLLCRTVSPTLAASLEPLADCRNLASSNLFIRYYSGRCLSEVAEMVRFPCSRGRFTLNSNKLHDFTVTIPRSYKYSMPTVFHRAFRAWGSLPTECFLFTYDLDSFNSRIERHVLLLDSSLIFFPKCVSYFSSVFQFHGLLAITPCVK